MSSIIRWEEEEERGDGDFDFDDGGGVVMIIEDVGSDDEDDALSIIDIDTRHVSLIFGLLGIGVLLPWNAFISREPYFHSRLCSSSDDDDGSDNGDDSSSPDGGDDGDEGGGDGVELWFGLIFNFAGFLALLAILAFKRRAEGSKADIRGSDSRIIEGSNDDDEDAVENGATRSTCTSRSTEQESIVAATATAAVDNLSHGRKLVVVPLSVYFVMFLITTSLVLLPKVHPAAFLDVTFLSLAIFGVCLAVAGTGIIAVAGIFPPTVALAPFFSGQSIGGVAISVANFVAAAAEAPDLFWEENCGHPDDGHDDGFANDRDSRPPISGLDLLLPPVHDVASSSECLPYRTDWATFVYFFLGSALLLACIAGFYLLDKLPATVYYRQLARNAGQQNNDNNDSTMEEHVARSKQLMLETETNDTVAAAYDQPENDHDFLSRPLLPEQHRRLEESLTLPPGGEEEATVGSVWRAIKFPAVTIFLAAFVTLSVFPAWTSKIESSSLCRVHGRLRNDLFEPLTFLLFNVPDLIARVMAGLTDVGKIRNLGGKLLCLSAGRFLLLPLFLFCNSSSSAMPTTVQNDLFPLVLGVTFAFTNGLCMSMAFMHAPQLISPAENVQELGSTVMNFALAFGLLFGSCFSFVYNWIGSGQWA